MKGVVAGLVMVLSALAGFGPGKTARAVPAVYVLGDSSLDVGNNNYLPGESVPRANKPFHGVDFPGPGGPKPTGRFSNGYNVADFIGAGIPDSTDLYMMGARKIGIINVGLSGCIPMVRAHDATGACNDGTNELAAGFNGALESFLADLAPRLPGLACSLADGFAHRQALIADPQAQGFVNATSACCGSGRLGGEARCLPTSNLCGDRDGYVYWDWMHATQRAAEMAAEAFFHDPAQFTMPLTFKQLAEKKGADVMEQ
ncbi:unnamed protein product [Triticum turgidum subsp. durum]|uniref:GDSL esterase/lipase n=1 Tax=Triticum turgidum subsp. durum TaxID=4567 RepID=A0A9R0U5K7_TRITD|nr:unnamed protein product [Triticum turgidum subsp. durum]